MFKQRGAVGALALLASLPLPAIVINDAGIPGYVTGNAEFTGVVKILGNGGSFICSGALISTSQVVTAGHCIAGASDWTVMFETGAGLFSTTAVSAMVHPLFQNRPEPLNGLQQYDVGILGLAALAPADAQVYGLKTDYIGTAGGVLDLVGYGRGGNPAVGQLASGTRRHAQNNVEFLVGSLNGIGMPDLPIGMTLTFGEGADNEGLPHAGDSGGPALFGDLILGIASFGNLPRTTPMLTGAMYFSGYMSLANPAIGGWVADNTTPEPGTFVLVGVLLSGMAFLRRRG